MKKKTFNNYFDKFPPILREMVVFNMKKEMSEPYSLDLYYHMNPLKSAFLWSGTEEGHEFWSAVEADAIHHKIWEVRK